MTPPDNGEVKCKFIKSSKESTKPFIGEEMKNYKPGMRKTVAGYFVLQ